MSPNIAQGCLGVCQKKAPEGAIEYFIHLAQDLDIGRNYNIGYVAKLLQNNSCFNHAP